VKAKHFSLSLVSLSLAAIVSMGYGQTEAVKLIKEGYTVKVAIGGKDFTTYHFDPRIAKAYLQPLQAANGVAVTRDFPVSNTIPPGHEQDHGFEPHQRPLDFAHGNIDGYNFWAEEVFAKYYGHELPPKFGHMVFRRLDEVRSGSSSGTVRATFDLVGGASDVLGQETQTFTFSGDSDTRTVDCQFVIHAGAKAIKFGDSKEGTFGVRLAPQLNAPRGAMVDSEGRHGESEIWGKRANWVNVDGTIDDQTVGVAVFDSPKSFRHPTYWHARGYGLLAANPFGLSFFLNDPKQDGSYTLTRGQSVQFSYRVVIHEGDYRRARIPDKYREYEAHP
jgi:hypothetical protein